MMGPRAEGALQGVGSPGRLHRDSKDQVTGLIRKSSTSASLKLDAFTRRTVDLKSMSPHRVTGLTQSKDVTYTFPSVRPNFMCLLGWAMAPRYFGQTLLLKRP